MDKRQVDILIVGGGLTGAILLLALANQGFRILLIDSTVLSEKVSPDFDARTLALSPASVRILEMLNIWPLLQQQATAIETIHVSEQYRFGRTLLKSEPQKPLGYVVEMQHINKALYQLVDKDQFLANTRLTSLDKSKGLAILNTENGEIEVQAKLIVAADGTDSTVRQLSALPVKTKDYKQVALVSNIGLARGHQHCAYERFRTKGTIAFLPMTNNRVSLVWALPPFEAQRLISLDEQAFLQELQKAFGYRLGRFIRLGKRVIYPLRQVSMPKKATWPLVFVGNAAQTLHPVAGQGFNLGLRDVATLAQCILQDGLKEEMLLRYQQMRQHDEKAITHFTDLLITLFSSKSPAISLVRHLGLIAVDNVQFLKQCLTHYTRGFAGITPDLVCGITLEKREQNEATS